MRGAFFFAMSKLTPPIKAAENSANYKNVYIFVAFFLQMSEKSCTFAVGFSFSYKTILKS